MSVKNSAAKRSAAKDARFRARFDEGADYDEHRKAASHAVMMSHHAFEMGGDKDAHKAAADAHRRVADMHDEAAEGDSSSSMKAADKK